MPYSKKIVRYRRRGKNITKYRPRRTKYKRLRRKVWKLARQLNVEYKSHYVNNFVSVDTTRSFTQMLLIPIGNQSTQRIGRRIKITSWAMSGLFQIDSAASATNIRMILLIDTQTNGALPTASDLLQLPSAQDALISPKNLNTGNRFKILCNKSISLSLEFPSKRIKYYKNLNLPVLFGGNTATVADLTDNSLYLFLTSNEGTNLPTFRYSSTIRYVDN